MSYRKLLQKQIAELEQKIAEAEGDKKELQAQLSRLMIAEYEEDCREEGNPQLLNG